MRGGARSVSCLLSGEPLVPWAALFPPSLSDSSPNNALVFTWLGTIYSNLGARLGWDETSTPAKASDLKSDPSQPPIQPVNFFCPAQRATNWTGEWEEVLDLSDVTVDAMKCCYFRHLCHLSAQRFTAQTHLLPLLIGVLDVGSGLNKNRAPNLPVNPSHNWWRCLQVELRTDNNE